MWDVAHLAVEGAVDVDHGGGRLVVVHVKSVLADGARRSGAVEGCCRCPIKI